MIALTKCLNPSVDYPELAPELLLVDAVGIGEQHPHRRFEYALALRALSQHQSGYTPTPGPYFVLDVGGAGSPFTTILERIPLLHAVIDPKENNRVEDFTEGFTPPADAIISISTIEHVQEPLPFLQACHRSLAPGGLLFLTMDACDYDEPDCSHFSHMRERIYGPMARANLSMVCQTLGFRRFGEADYAYHGDQLYGNYTFASLAMTKEG